MKFAQILIILLLTSAITPAQNIDVKWGKETKSDKKLGIGSVLGGDPNGYLITRYNITGIFGKSKTWIARHNLDHEVEYTIEVPDEINNKDIAREGMYKVKDEIFIFSSQNDKKADINKLYISIVDKNGKLGEEKLIDEILYKGKKDKGGFNIHHLPNSENFLITHNEGYSKKGNEEVNYKLYDYDLKLKWEKAIELPYKDKKFGIGGYQIDEAGNVYLYGTMPISKDLTKKVIFAYYPATNKLEEVKVEFGKAYRISDLNFAYSKGELQFTGFY